MASTKVPTDWLNWSHSGTEALTEPVNAQSSEIWRKKRRTCRVRHHVGRDRAEVGGEALGQRPAERHRQEEGRWPPGRSRGSAGGSRGTSCRWRRPARERAVRVTVPRIMIPGTAPAGRPPGGGSRRRTSRGRRPSPPRARRRAASRGRAPTGIRVPSITFGRAWRARMRSRGISKCVDITGFLGRGRPLS